MEVRMVLLTVIRVAVVLCVAGYALVLDANSVLAQEKKLTVIGRVEKVWIRDAKVVLRAKIDTGAHTTSLGVENIETFKRGNRDWVRFSFLNGAGASVTLERRLVQFKPLKKTNVPGTEIRPVILLKLCVADIYRLTQVNLARRSKLNYPILIGRRFLFAKAVVNVAQQYTSEPHCKEMNGG